MQPKHQLRGQPQRQSHNEAKERCILEAGAKCTQCPFSKEGRPVKPVFAVGPKNPIAMLVGESPSREDVDEGVPLTGNTGQELDMNLAKAGLPRGKLFIINAIACRPSEGRTEAEMRKAVNCCRPWFLEQIAHLPEDLPVLGMGRWAASQLMGKEKGVMLTRGFIRSEFKLPRKNDLSSE